MTRRELLNYHIEERDKLKRALEPAELVFGYVTPEQREKQDAERNTLLDFHERAITWLVEGEREPNA